MKFIAIVLHIALGSIVFVGSSAQGILTSASSGLHVLLRLSSLSLLAAKAALAATYNVGNIAALQSAVNNAAAGDEIVLADGRYQNSAISIGSSSITVRAATPGGVFLDGTNAITISGHHVTFSGFQFTTGSISGQVIVVTGNYNKLTQLNFDGYSAQKYINLQGQYDEVTYCNFQNKPASAAIGNIIHITPNNNWPNYALIRYCSFQNMPGNGGDNGNECIRIGNGAQSTYSCRTTVEFCYFTNTGGGDSEAISVKSRENVLRFNTFVDNQNAMMVFRNGNNNVAYGNFFIRAGGIRVKEANNIYCYNSYFQNAGVGGTMVAVTYVYVSPNLNNVNFIHNTFVECGLIDLASGATGNTWANNIFKKSSGNIFAGSSLGISWAGNIYSGTLGISISSGMNNTNPQLILTNGYYYLSSASPAIDMSSASYPAILDVPNIDDDPALLLDIEGQARPSDKTQKDVGAEEFDATGPITNRPLVLADVGPKYLGGPGGAPTTSRPSSLKPTSKPTTAQPTTWAPTSRMPTNVPTDGAGGGTEPPAITAPPTTPIPTTNPTTSPTSSPSKSPTSIPTNIPTKFPTMAPTNTPTNTPTSFPTTRLPTATCLHSTVTCGPSIPTRCCAGLTCKGNPKTCKQ